MTRHACLGAVLLLSCLDFNKVESQFFESNCADGLDGDGDHLTDCADPDCLGRTCAPAYRCTGAPVCLAGGACSGAPKVCDTPPAFCLLPTGTCSQTTGACSYAPDTAATCDDSNPCTVNDHCGADAGCSGTSYSCLNTECAWSACLGDGGCSAPLLRTGLPCDGGVCRETGACATFSYRPSNFDPAAIAARGIGPALSITCANASFDSTDGGSFWCNGQPAPAQAVVSQDGGPDAVVLAVSELSIGPGGSLSLTGARPVIFAVWGNATIDGTLWAGAGQAPPALCDAEDGAADGVLVGGGGGGGGHGGGGGNGGDGDAVGHGGRAGTPSGTASLVPLRGGCRGGRGGRSSDPTGAGGRGGAGGGAVQISALGVLTISGTVTASGAGGQGGLGVLSGSNGGGAGGSGGAVLLEGQDVLMAPGARLTANGGGGGGGGGVADGAAGQDGHGTTATPAPGGTAGVACAGKGGQGAAALGGPTAGENASALCSGGGGGGGLGRIRVNASTLCRADAGVQSPLPSFGGACP